MQKKEYISDEKLVSAIMEDDHYAFDELFSKYAPPLFTFVMSIVKEKYWAEETVQDVFIRIWEKRKDLDPNLSFKSYLFTIALNATKRIYRKKLQTEKFKQDILLEINVDQVTDIDVVEYGNLLQYVDDIINKLPASRREIFIMSKKDGLKNAEIAERLNISEQTVKNQLASAMKFLRSEAATNRNEIGLLFFLLFYRL